MEVLKNVEMKEYSNMKVGGTADELIFIEDKNELKEVLQTRKRVFLLGNGTNTLINNGHLNISFVSLKKLQKIEVVEKHDDYDLVRVEAGLDLDDLIKFMEENDYFIENINDMIKSGDFTADREITEKDFIESLFVNNVTIYVKGRETDFMLDLDAAPDYLMGHLACMEIDSAYGVECGGMNG